VAQFTRVGVAESQIGQQTEANIEANVEANVEPGCAACAVAGERKETRTSAVIFPLGPYHPLLPEPYALRLRLHGEQVVAATAPATGYGRRDLLDLVRGQPIEDALVVLERVCAHAGQGYRLALSIAIERAARMTAPRSAQLTRVFFAELEMALSALWSLSELARALNMRGLRTQGLEQRERIYEAAANATGQRVYWAIARPGGVREGIQIEEVAAQFTWMRETVEGWRVTTAPRGVLRAVAERVDARQVKPQRESDSVASDEAALPVEAGVAPLAYEDARRSAPYDGYRAITVDWTPLDDLPPGGVADVTSCALRLVTRLKLSYDIMHVCAETLSDSPRGQGSGALRAGQGSATIQTAHGPARIEVTLANDQTVADVRITTPCAEALTRAPTGLLGRTLADVPATLVGLDLCPSCADL
jgi:Ni,Fe-hydrogenase III large subunit